MLTAGDVLFFSSRVAGCAFADASVVCFSAWTTNVCVAWDSITSTFAMATCREFTHATVGSTFARAVLPWCSSPTAATTTAIFDRLPPTWAQSKGSICFTNDLTFKRNRG